MGIDIGLRLKEERERLKLSQAALAEIGGKKKLAQLKYEQGESSPTAAYLCAVERVGVDIQYVVTGMRASKSLAPDEQELLALFRAAPLAVKAAAIGALQGGAQAAPSGKKTKKQVFSGEVSGQVAMGKIINKGKNE